MIAIQMSPLAKLFAKIKAEMVANGTPFADSAAEAAFRTWLQAAWLDSGCTQEFACLYQPATSTEVSIAIRGVTGHKADVWWGDGSDNTYTMASDSDATASHEYASGAKRPIVLLGRITSLSGANQPYGGRVWESLRSLTSIVVDICPAVSSSLNALHENVSEVFAGGCSALSGSISGYLPSGLTTLRCWACFGVTGNVADLPSAVTYFHADGCLVTYNTTEGGREWADNVSFIYLSPYNTGVFTSPMADALLIDLADTATFAGSKSINIVGNCGAPTAAAYDAIASLIAQGVTVNTN